MAGASAQDKTEKASPRRLREAREKGQVPRSRDLTTALVMVAGAGLLMSSGPGIMRAAQSLMRRALTIDPALLSQPRMLPDILGTTLGAALALLLPLFIGLTVIALAAPMLVGGWNFSARAMIPDFSRLNPLAGLGRIFSVNGLMELLKSVIKFSILGGVAAAAWWSKRGEMAGLVDEPLLQGIAHGGALCLQAFAFLCGGLLLIALVDVPWQIYHHGQQLRMTRQEVRDEHKQSEGRPEVKARIRNLQHQAANRRMMEKLPTADVVVTNPTHYAVALKYSPGNMRAPVVVAKGADLIALKLRELAGQHRIPILEAPPLARALFRSAELDAEIPVTLYAAVAQVLTYVYQLKMYRGGPRPRLPEIAEVPGGEP
ncbi:MAG TPA: flagellar biosynthesis protein FlhB [Stenotrophobium sp.]|jgi:flagellar biosynthetic protein FlhB|nr:flagellar biosynthesis protein FlhB [Stenotrophobium sp.]